MFLGVLWLQALYACSACGSHHSSIPSQDCAPNSRAVGRRAGLAGRMHGKESCSLSSGPSPKSPHWTRPGLLGWEGVTGPWAGGAGVCPTQWGTGVTLGYLPQTGDSSVPPLTPHDVRVPLASAHGRQTPCPGHTAPKPPLTDRSVGQQCPACSSEGGPSWQQPLCNSRAPALL